MGLLEKIKENIFLIPAERFEGLTKDPGYKDSFVYLLACLAISIPIRIIVGLLGIGDITLLITATIIGVIFSIPIFYVGYIILHILLKLVGAKEGLSKTVQVFIYGGTCALIFGSIPLIGFIAGLISLVNIVVGAAKVHKISNLRAAIAVVVIPIIVGIVLAIAFVGLIAAALTSVAAGSTYTY